LIILNLEVIESLGEPDKIGEPLALTVMNVKDEEDTKPTNTTISGNGFYGNRPQQPAAQDRAIPSRSGPATSSTHGTIYPIEGLSPYAGKWTIKARVTNKSEIRTWQKATGEGKLFSVNLLDESGEIKATAFNDQCDMLYDLLQEGSVYYISTCRVQFAKKQFSNLPNDYEMTFERDSVVEKAEDTDNVPQVRYNFTNIGDLQTVETDSTIDIIGVVKEVADVSQIISKSTQKPYDKRDLTLVDESGYSVKLTIWGKLAGTFDEMPGTIVAFKGAKVSDFDGRSLSLLSSGSMSISPDITEAHSLKGWYDLDGRTGTFHNHSNMAGVGAASGRTDRIVTVAQVRDDGLGTNAEKPDYFTLTATISYAKHENFAYPACLKETCNKKVTEIGDGTWRCEYCSINHPRPEYRFIMSLNVADHTGQMWLNCFDDVGRIIMGMSADKLMELKETGEHMKLFEATAYKAMTFKCRAKMDTYQDQQKYVPPRDPSSIALIHLSVRYQVTGATPINFTTEANRLAELIKTYSIE
jgi:replication factor A1